MITQSIEKALISGKAWLKTYVLSGSQVGKIVVPDNNFVIITSVTIQPFSNIAQGHVGLVTEQVDAVSIISVELSNQETDRVNFVASNNYYIYTAPDGANLVRNSEPQTFDTYLVRSKNVYIQVALLPGINGRSGAAALDNSPLSNSQLPLDTAGYAGAVITANIVTNLGTNYSPAGVPDSGNAIVPGVPLFFNGLPNYRDEDCKIISGAFNSNNNIPLVVVQYVVLNEQARKDFQ